MEWKGSKCKYKVQDRYKYKVKDCSFLTYGKESLPLAQQTPHVNIIKSYEVLKIGGIKEYRLSSVQGCFMFDVRYFHVS